MCKAVYCKFFCDKICVILVRRGIHATFYTIVSTCSPSMRQTTAPSSSPKLSSQTVPQTPLKRTSTRPEVAPLPSARRAATGAEHSPASSSSDPSEQSRWPSHRKSRGRHSPLLLHLLQKLTFLPAAFIIQVIGSRV